MENKYSSTAPPNAKAGSSGCPGKKDVALPNLSSPSEVAATIVASNDDVTKGKSVVAADNEELKPHIIAERKRRNQMNEYFAELQTLMPQIPEKSSKGTILGHAIGYIKSLEKKAAMMDKRRQELALAWQAPAEDTASSSAVPPQAAQGIALAAMSSDVPDACSESDVPPLPPQPLAAAKAVPAMSPDAPPPLQQPLAAAEPAPPPQFPVTARLVGFQTWLWPDYLVLSVSNDNAYINVCVPRHLGMRTMVMVVSVLNKYGIDVLTAQVHSDAVCSMFNIYARVTALGGGNPSALEVYQLAVSEILVWLNTD